MLLAKKKKNASHTLPRRDFSLSPSQWNFKGTEFESLHNVSQNTSQEKNLTEKDNFGVPGHEDGEDEEDPEEIENLEEKRQEFDETKSKSIHSNGLEWKRSEVGNCYIKPKEIS